MATGTRRWHRSLRAVRRSMAAEVREETYRPDFDARDREGYEAASEVSRDDRISCGCRRGPADDRCCCWNHMDIPRGIRSRACSRHGGAQ